MMVSFVLSFFPRDVLDEILNLIESVSEDFPSYSYMVTCSFFLTSIGRLSGKATLPLLGLPPLSMGFNSKVRCSEYPNQKSEPVSHSNIDNSEIFDTKTRTPLKGMNSLIYQQIISFKTRLFEKALILQGSKQKVMKSGPF